MRHPTARLRLEELGSRILPSVSPLPSPHHAPIAHTAGQLPAHAPADRFDGLDGTLRGTVTPAMGIPDGGLRFSLDGSGKLDGMDRFSVTGSLHGVGFLAKGHATGELTLTNSHGTIELSLTGPEQPGFSPLPGTFHFTITGGTGAYKGLHETGDVSLHTQTTGNTTSFRLAFA